jgi:hypothetical protein
MRRFAALLAVAMCLPAAIATNGAAAAGCPNEALRTGPSALLPGCRAYEMVSPLEKGGGIVNPALTLHAAPSGEALSYFSTSSFAGSQASPLGNGYIARRGANWETESVDAPQHNPSGLLLTPSAVSSRDLDQTLEASRVAVTPGAAENGSNLFIRDNQTGTRTLLASSPGSGLFLSAAGGGLGVFVGADPSWSTVVIHSNETLPVAGAEEPAPGVENLYDFSGDQLHLVDVLPDGTVPAEGAHVGGFGQPNQNLVSSDGSETFFQVGSFGNGPLYMRRDNRETLPVSLARGGEYAGEVMPAEFGVASADGSVVYFSTNYSLLEGSTNENTPTIYRYEPGVGPSPGRLTEITSAVVPGGPRVTGILGAGEDGSYLYFSATGALAEGATEAGGLSSNFYVWHDGTVRWIGQTREGDGEFGLPPQFSISPDGRYLGLASFSPLRDEDGSSPNCPTDPTTNNLPGDCRDVYLYEYETGRLHCVSCDGPGLGSSTLGGQGTGEGSFSDEFPRAVLNDGTVFFDTPNPLLARDSNGVEDVYTWHQGVEGLVSTGTSEQPSRFGDATPDGSSVFFLTNQSLVKQDTDEATDVYVDRELGGLAAQTPPGQPGPCEGEGCRGQLSTPPEGLPPGSGAVARVTCGQLVGKARQARVRSRRLSARFQKARHRGQAASARRLGHRAAAAQKEVAQTHKQAKRCEEQN